MTVDEISTKVTFVLGIHQSKCTSSNHFIDAIIDDIYRYDAMIVLHYTMKAAAISAPNTVTKGMQ